MREQLPWECFPKLQQPHCTRAGQEGSQPCTRQPEGSVPASYVKVAATTKQNTTKKTLEYSLLCGEDFHKALEPHERRGHLSLVLFLSDGGQEKTHLRGEGSRLRMKWIPKKAETGYKSGTLVTRRQQSSLTSSLHSSGFTLWYSAEEILGPFTLWGRHHLS